MKYLLSLCLLFVLYLPACVPVPAGGSSSTATSSGVTDNGIYHDQVFHEQVQTVQLLGPDDEIYEAVVPITQNYPVRLSFDVLELDGSEGIYEELNVKLIHCNADWRQSALYNMDYLNEYNEFPITQEAFSYNTKVPFTHYTFTLPQVKMPGNYVLQVYQGSDESNVLFTKRYMVYDLAVGIQAEVVRSGGVRERDTHQQVEFLIDYNKLDIPNPYNDVYVVVRQNQQWFNTIEGLKPTFVREDVKELEYVDFDLKNNFWGANEHRFFDLRTTNALGQNVAEIMRDESPVEAYLLPDRSRATEAYSQFNDLNGGYITNNLDMPGGGGPLNSDYLMTHFFLYAEEPVEGEVYVIGAFENRRLTPEVKMKYDALRQGYTLDVLLKQGFYNYLYYVKNEESKSPYQFDGSHFETENLYEIFVYTKPIGARADLLVGYTRLIVNERP
ncbi:MAG: DUF5103 domain-containing protein [Cyclobacteriaceae bacterium]